MTVCKNVKALKNPPSSRRCFHNCHCQQSLTAQLRTPLHSRYVRSVNLKRWAGTCKIRINLQLMHCSALDPSHRFYSACPFRGSLLHLGRKICPGICSIALQCQSWGEIKTRANRAGLLPLQPHLFQGAFHQSAEHVSSNERGWNQQQAISNASSWL